MTFKCHSQRHSRSVKALRRPEQLTGRLIVTGRALKAAVTKTEPVPGRSRSRSHCSHGKARASTALPTLAAASLSQAAGLRLAGWASLTLLEKLEFSPVSESDSDGIAAVACMRA